MINLTTVEVQWFSDDRDEDVRIVKVYWIETQELSNVVRTEVQGSPFKGTYDQCLNFINAVIPNVCP